MKFELYRLKHLVGIVNQVSKTTKSVSPKITMKHILRNAEQVLCQFSVLKMHNIGPEFQCDTNISWLLVELFCSHSF